LDATHANWVLELLRTESILHQFLVEAYCAMPDHLHFLAFGTSTRSNLLKFAKSFKQQTAFAYLEKTGERLWQNNFYDHILRSSEAPNRVAAYIWLNPVRRGLCRDFQEYPYSGSFSRPWKISMDSAWMPPWKRARMPA